MRIAILFLLLCVGDLSAAADKVQHNYVTISDERHFPLLINLIASIHKTDYKHLDEIAVYDLGLAPYQKQIIESIDKVNVYTIEKVHPDLFTYFKTNPDGRTVRGWYAWKPVVLKQALERFPYAIYLDAGNIVLNSPDNLFKHVQQNEYFLLNIAPHTLEPSVTTAVKEKFPDIDLNSVMIDAGFQGISRSMNEDYIIPMYNMAKDIVLFKDDGSARLGLGAGRHDQTLFSILAHQNYYTLNDQGWSQLNIDGKKVPFHMHWNQAEVNPQTVIYRSRWNNNYDGNKIAYIHWRIPAQ